MRQAPEAQVACPLVAGHNFFPGLKVASLDDDPTNEQLHLHLVEKYHKIGV